MKYFFILGRQPKLSAAEIKAKFNQLHIHFEEEAKEDAFLILKFNQAIDYSLIMKQLAGTIKIGEIVKEINGVKPAELIDLIPQKETKVNFGISVYPAKAKPRIHSGSLGKELKRELKSQGRSARFVVGKENPLSSVIVQKNLILKGIEIAILKSQNKLYLGATKAVQPFENFSQLDYGRPARDAKRGMLPPKLAQMMINLSETNFKQKILDPFCGIGTVLQQALVLGYKNVIGSDIDNKAIQASEKNLTWLADFLRAKPRIHSGLPAKLGNYSLIKSKIKDITKYVKPNSIDAIVTEPDLGPPLKGRESPLEIQRNVQQLEQLYKTALEQFAKVLKPNGTIVMVVPQFKSANPQLQLGNLKVTNQWQYARPGQRVVRNIIKLRKS